VLPQAPQAFGGQGSVGGGGGNHLGSPPAWSRQRQLCRYYQPSGLGGSGCHGTGCQQWQCQVGQCRVQRLPRQSRRLHPHQPWPCQCRRSEAWWPCQGQQPQAWVLLPVEALAGRHGSRTWEMQPAAGVQPAGNGSRPEAGRERGRQRGPEKAAQHGLGRRFLGRCVQGGGRVLPQRSCRRLHPSPLAAPKAGSPAQACMMLFESQQRS